ncbi:UPF0728 protein v1g117062-like [Amphibalanus amphitrite]|uniref:UPF0728 protein v1g117062-like n=1 Tax=Amphibalanus amphitrite TaxID=1232801 RepID=UPI001C912FB1|nr:UPF0728 protein v1g117062-like [Amphibalanus amphitrite]
MTDCSYDPAVKVYLGPILILGGLHHLPARLQGLLRALMTAGVKDVELTEVPDYRRLWIEVHDMCVWTGDPGDLCWGGDGSQDPLCTEAVTAVTSAL